MTYETDGDWHIQGPPPHFWWWKPRPDGGWQIVTEEGKVIVEGLTKGECCQQLMKRNVEEAR